MNSRAALVAAWIAISGFLTGVGFYINDLYRNQKDIQATLEDTKNRQGEELKKLREAIAEQGGLIMEQRETIAKSREAIAARDGVIEEQRKIIATTKKFVTEQKKFIETLREVNTRSMGLMTKVRNFIEFQREAIANRDKVIRDQQEIIEEALELP